MAKQALIRDAVPFDEFALELDRFDPECLHYPSKSKEGAFRAQNRKDLQLTVFRQLHQNLLVHNAEKILLMRPLNFRGITPRSPPNGPPPPRLAGRVRSGGFALTRMAIRTVQIAGQTASRTERLASRFRASYEDQTTLSCTSTLPRVALE